MSVEVPSGSPENTPKEFDEATVFEHLFPGNRFADLPRFDPRNTPLLIWRHLIELPVIDEQAHIAQINESGYARRFDLPHPDKASVVLKALRLDPTPEVPDVRWFGDLLKFDEGERVGGMGLRHVSRQRDEHRDPFSRFSLSVGITDMFRIHAVGVLGRAREPKAIILYTEGEREPKGGRRVRDELPEGKLVVES